MLTGESKPVQKNEGDKVIGGSVNGDRFLEIRKGKGFESIKGGEAGYSWESQDDAVQHTEGKTG